jgi:hypothetical protein
MKTLLTLGLVLLMSIAALATSLTDDPNPQDFDVNNQYQTKTRGFGVGMFPKKGTLTMNLLIENYSTKSILITLKDKKGKVYFSQLLGKKQRRNWLKINMEEMKDAVYEVIVFNGRDKITKEINLRTQQVPLPEPKLEEQRLISMK